MKLKHVFLFLVLFPLVLLAIDVPVVVPEGDAFQSLMALVMSWKSLSPLAIGAGGIVVLVQVLKQFVGDTFKYKRLAVASLGVIYGVVLAISKGMGAVEAIVTALFVSGGAIAIYEALKPALQKLNLKA